ncbi:MAG: hypothetical protein HZB40_12260 [Rhodocyclales bacterium]|nr:hypothetical protein [Rhodocyclales bacterium]
MKLSFNRTSLGALMGSLGLCLMFVAAPMSASAAAAPAAEAAPAATGAKFGMVWRIRGEVTASKVGAPVRKLREGDPVYVGERLRAGGEAEAVLRTDDAGVVAVRPNTEFVAERFAAEDKPSDGFAVRLVTGSLRLISGWIGQTNRSGHVVVTPSATIGIRGTDHEPYVPSPELAKQSSNPEGTYDKVNRGGTTLKVGENKVDIDPGQVGFARNPPKTKDRALLTILLPVLLDKVPSFYVPGEFDTELDRYSQNADQEAKRLLEQKRKTPGAAAECAPVDIAKTWLAQLDGAIAKGDAQGVIAMFAQDAKVKANVKEKDGKMASVDLTRDELAQSTITAIKGLKDYRQRRVWTDARLVDLAGSAACDNISLRSAVVEQGKQSGKPYRFESLEQFVLVQRGGKWLAIKAETTQQ